MRNDPGPEPRFTIAHISDPHISRRYHREHIKSFKTLLRSILDAGCDHIVVTGDIASTADKDDYLLAREIFSTFGLLDSARLTVVPGNHDVFGGPHSAMDVFEFPRRIRAVDHLAMRDSFLETFAETMDGARHPDPASPFPFIKHIGPFDIIGLDSTMPWSLLRNPVGSNGRVSDAQMDMLKGLVDTVDSSTRIPIVAMHHHISSSSGTLFESGLWRRAEAWTMRLWNRARLLRVLSALGVRCVLHGHVHQNTVHALRGIQVANGAGAVCDDPLPFLKYNLLRSGSDGFRITTQVLPVPYYTPAMPSIRPRPRLVPQEVTMEAA